MSQLQPEETDLLGSWELVGGEVKADDTCERITSLLAGSLEKVKGAGWETLYQDPGDGRYWELTYPESHWQGGGPPRLTYLSREQAVAKYGDLIQKP